MFPPKKNKLILILLAFTCVLFLNSGTVRAQCNLCTCEPPNHGSSVTPPGDYTTRLSAPNNTIRGRVVNEHNATADHILLEFLEMEVFFVQEFWFQRLLPAMMMMTEQMTAVASAQMFALGTMLDGKQALEAQQLAQRLTAEAHQDYHPDLSMCTVGTNVRSLAAAERNAEYTTYVLSQRSQDRQLSNMRSFTARGEFDNICYRMRQFRQYYCDLQNNNERMDEICDPDPAVIMFDECRAPSPAISASSRNRDISFGRTINYARTLDVDFYSDGAGAATTWPPLSEDERHIFALSANLYGHNVFQRIPETTMRTRSGQNLFIHARSVAARRSVVEHSFNHIVGIKSQSKFNADTVTVPYMEFILQAAGVTDPAEVTRLLGSRPSYDAQMEVLTKRLYQSPTFYTDLYDEPANLKRKSVALQAIGLMQNFDMWNSALRTEMQLSILLEMEIMELQNYVARQMGRVEEGGVELDL